MKKECEEEECEEEEEEEEEEYEEVMVVYVVVKGRHSRGRRWYWRSIGSSLFFLFYLSLSLSLYRIAKITSVTVYYCTCNVCMYVLVCVSISLRAEPADRVDGVLDWLRTQVYFLFLACNLLQCFEMV